MGTVKDMLELAKSQVGYDRFKDDKTGTKYGRWYAEYVGNGYYAQNGVPYCAMYISWLLYHTNTLCAWFPNAVAFDATDKPILGAYYIDKRELEIGDIISFDWNKDRYGDHVGLVIAVHDTYVITNEGNTDNGKVKERIRYYKDITCGVRPMYANAKSKLIIDGWFGKASVTELQRQLGTTKDGVVTGQSKDDSKYTPALVSVMYNYGGSLVVKTLQKIIGANTDGYWGKNTNIKLQEYLNKHGYNCGEVDGYFGNNTARALQRSLNDEFFLKRA